MENVKISLRNQKSTKRYKKKREKMNLNIK